MEESLPTITLPDNKQHKRGVVMTAPNPRRTPSRDIRLLGDGSKRQKLSHSPEKGQSSDIVTSHPGLRKNNSEESGSSDQSATKWFDKANKNVLSSGRRHLSNDDEPPFYMSNHAHYVPKSFAASETDRRFGTQSRLDSENEDLRGVIDDLTVENKRLRHILKAQNKHSRSTPSELSHQQDKLFEVRMHGLPPEKRRELEFLLKNFATSVHTSILSKASSTKTSPSTSPLPGRTPVGIKKSNTDSGYASNSNSAQSSGVDLGHRAPVTSKTTTIKNYLHDIPDTLLPRRAPAMTEHAKMALVVRRLEQLFTGRKAAPGEHSQPLQQQEVSNSAAKTDQMMDGRHNLKGYFEGTREAYVMAPESKINLDTVDSTGQGHIRHEARAKRDGTNLGASPISRPISPDQRPTRPLDLDIHRAQIASDNIQYIRHLGLSYPEFSSRNEGDENHWMYLNLLSSMAQLHTLNVTSDFVRKAVKKLSKRFELSKDGHKVRWVGGPEGTKFTAEDERAIENIDTDAQESAEDGGTGGSSKRSKTNSTSNAAVTLDTPSEDKTSGLQTSSNSKLEPNTISGSSNFYSSNQQSTNVTKPTTISNFDYKPVVYRERAVDDFGNSYLRDSDGSSSSFSNSSSGLVRALSRSNLNHQATEEGLLTFYNNPFFCSDFSADNIPSNMRSTRPIIIGETLGVPMPDDIGESPLRYHNATYFVSEFAPKPYTPKEGDEQKLNIKMPSPDTLSEVGENEIVPMELEVCGVGGVMPEDNFAIDVKIQRVKVAPGTLTRTRPFSRRKYSARYKYRTMQSNKIELLPSKLPPPSYIFFTSSSDSDIGDVEETSEASSDDDESSSRPNESHPPPPAFMMQFSGSSNEAGVDDGEEADSSSIDMLGIARALDPQQIAEQERVYLINQPAGTGRADAGSLAATVGASRSSESGYEAADSPSSSNSSHFGSRDGVEDMEADE